MKKEDSLPEVEILWKFTPNDLMHKLVNFKYSKVDFESGHDEDPGNIICERVLIEADELFVVGYGTKNDKEEELNCIPDFLRIKSYCGSYGVPGHVYVIAIQEIRDIEICSEQEKLRYLLKHNISEDDLIYKSIDEIEE